MAYKLSMHHAFNFYLFVFVKRLYTELKAFNRAICVTNENGLLVVIHHLLTERMS